MAALVIVMAMAATVVSHIANPANQNQMEEIYDMR